MKRTTCLALILAAGLAIVPATAHADLTGFVGFSPTPATRSTRGFSIGLTLVVIGFEFEYANTSEDDVAPVAPGLTTFMVNGLVQTPTHVQLYLTAGGGVYHETLETAANTSFATDIGGGVKIPLAGPIRARIDYRVFTLTGTPISHNPQRFYVGLNLSF